jgi:3-phenylpropionate/trans-cinnamate dioxygenase ferredoxin reductase subunit
MSGVAIVGGGVAAQRCAFGLRDRGYEGPVTLVAREPELPYDRTLLSKGVLAADAPELRPLRPRDAYDELDVRLLEGEAVGLDAAGRRVLLAGGETLAYDMLVVCTGGLPRLPTALDAPGVHVLRELSDALALRAALKDRRSLVVIGAGFIGGEVASSARARGLEVTLVEALEQPLAGVVGAELGARVATLHRAHGVRVLTGVPVHGVRGGAGGYEVALADGRALAADAVVVGAGMVPATDWLRDSPVRLDDGVVTDAACRTNVPGVLAAGDCARWWHAGYGVSMRIEHWDTAARHGSAAAAAALGDGAPFTPLPFFWSDQHGVKLQWVGYAPAWDAVEIEDGDAPRAFSARFLRDGRLVAVLAADQPRVVAAARKELGGTVVNSERGVVRG